MLVGLALPVLGAQAGGVVPAAVNWNDITAVSSGSTNTQTISGIGETITLRAEITSTSIGGIASGAFFVSGTTPFVSDSVPLANGNLDFQVANLSDVTFSVTGEGEASWSIDCTVTIKYKSAGSSTFDQTLDSFTVALGP